MHIDNITSDSMTLTNNGKAMLIKIYEEKIERLKDLCNKYEEEHKTTFEEWKKAINIINELEKWLDKKEKSTFNSWNKGIHEVQRKLQELKGSDKE